MKHYPLEPECNPNVPTGNHVASCEAAAAYEMARTTPNQAKLDDWFFANQGQLTREVVKQAAEEQAGIKDFDAKYPAAIQAVRTDATLGGLLNVNSTPTIFINGRRIPGAGLPPQYLDALIEIILAEGK
jgi:protein-disulfide isomerase